MFTALQIDRAAVLKYFNYGFYTATFAIILIAVMQINSIASKTLRCRYLNQLADGASPD